MYTRITARCQMACKHCCMNATAKGQDMTRETFLAACKLSEDRGDTIFLGGGEPSLHPLLFDFIGLALAHDTSGTGPGAVGIVTNGGVTKIALKLAEMARHGLIACELSQDALHDPIDPAVVKAFTKKPSPESYGVYGTKTDDHDYRGIRSVKEPYRQGRWKSGKAECACVELCIEPDGRIFACGCRKVQYGTVFNPQIPDTYQSGECGKNQPQPEVEEVTADKELVTA